MVMLFITLKNTHWYCSKLKVEFTPDFSAIRISQSLVFCVVIFRSLFVLFLLTLYCLSFDSWFLLIPGYFQTSLKRQICHADFTSLI
jgi:hypothetical protein